MPCFRPLVCYRGKYLTAKGKRPMVFSERESEDGRECKLPCGRCEGCRLERSRQWAIRCMHEASLWERNCFITLTYDNEHLPAYGSLCVRDFQLFIKRLRKAHGEGIRYFHCGEYGPKLGRPHYHGLLFNFDFNDHQLWKVRGNFRLDVSEELQRLWPLGFSSVGSATFQSAGYVARYLLKKQVGDDAWKHYDTGYHDLDTGEVICKRPEYITMSRRPGIAREWFNRYHKDVYPLDEVIINGRKMKPPKYYDTQYAVLNPSGMDEVKMLREVEAYKHFMDNTVDRLEVRRKVCLAKLGMLPRGLITEI